MRRKGLLALVAAQVAAAALALAAAGPASAGNPHTTTTTTTPAPPAGPLVLYDTTGPYGWLGELYATEVVNLAGHFGTPTAHPVASYTAGELNRYSAVFYIGSTYDEPLPSAFLDDVLATTKPVVWAYDNIWQLTGHIPDFATRYGWMWSAFDTSNVSAVIYKGTTLTRSTANQGGIMDYSSLDSTKATVVASAVRSDGTTFPWAVRSGNLTYVGEIPFSYTSETDRVLIFDDLMFDALAPATTQRHRALVRLEDIDPTSDPNQIKADVDYLSAQGIPFGFTVTPEYKDPTGYYNNGVPQDVHLKDSPALVDALRYALAHGGVMTGHGLTHQWDGGVNPFTGVTGDDAEFFREIENADHTIDYTGPVPEDSPSWAAGRFSAAAKEFKSVKLDNPTISLLPNYAGSPVDYRAEVAAFPVRWERSLYFGGVLSGGAVDYSHMTGQLFPYVVKDVYGSKVLPENLGDISPTAWYAFPARLPADIIDGAQKNLVVRDGFASFFFHPYTDISYLQQTVAGLKAAGYTFVSPSSL
jgi:uncharacterized protein YdaL